MRKYIIFGVAAVLLFVGCHHQQENKVKFSGRILMLGRSVMAGWFEHWGGYEHVQKEGFDLYYGPMYSPPQIVQSAISQMEAHGVDSSWVVFFKLCFEDFEGGSQEEARQNLERNKEYVKQVYAQVKSKGAVIIVATALPKVCEYTTSYLRWNHRQYNQWLMDMASSNDDFYVFDMYSVLADSNGCLRSDYASSPYDSHPNHRGYSALDGKFFPFLKANFQVGASLPGF